MKNNTGIKFIRSESFLVEDNEIEGYEDGITAIDCVDFEVKGNKIFIEGYTDKLQNILDKMNDIQISAEREISLKTEIKNNIQFAIEHPNESDSIMKIKESMGLIASWIAINEALQPILLPIITTLAGV